MEHATKTTPRGTRFPLAGALLFYAALAIAGLLWRAILDGELFDLAPRAASATWSPRPWSWVERAGAGFGAGLGLVASSRLWVSHSASGRRLRDAMTEVVSGLSLWAIAGLTLASSIAEEVFFRGALQAHWGWTLATLVFAAAHFVPTAALRIWSVFALLGGAVFGFLYEWCGGLLAPIVAHAVVNGINLSWLARFERAPATERPAV